MSMGTQPVSGTTAYSAKQATLPMWWMRCSPLCRRCVPSIMFGPVAMWKSHTCELPERHDLQRPQAGTNDRITCWPGRTDVTPGPTASTVPAPSWPSTTGSAMGASPCMKWRSLRQMPAAPIFTRTSPALGSSSSTSSITNGVFGSYRTAAFNVGLLFSSIALQFGSSTSIFHVYIPLPPSLVSIAARQTRRLLETNSENPSPLRGEGALYQKS